MQTLTSETVAIDAAHLIHPLHSPALHQTPYVWAEGRGAMIVDSEGNEFFDGLSGLWNVNVGHGRRELAFAALEQMTTMAFCSSFAGSTNHNAARLGAKLSELAYPSINSFFFTSGGAESAETAIKTARYYWRAQGRPSKTKIISLTRGYHGLTLGAMSATGIPSFAPMFEPQAPGFINIPSYDPYRFQVEDSALTPGVAAANRLEEAILREGPETVAAFIAEPVQGAGGIIVPPADYFPRIREICDRHQILFISDEVITGFGRTGRWFGLEHWQVEPDMMLFAKGITSGYVPLGGIGVSDAIRATIEGATAEQRWMHAFTYSGHPTCCAVALANIQLIEDEGLVARAEAIGAYLLASLRPLATLPIVGDIRGLGMMAAIELVADKETKTPFAAAHRVTPRLLQGLTGRGIFTRVQNDTIYLAPPLITTTTQVDAVLEAICATLDDLCDLEVQP